ncbi:MAG: hypothetical protein JNK02_07185 [Planctomycetes bacterium]|nr:hypothetical protein [Planctomycetota bacterium]
MHETERLQLTVDAPAVRQPLEAGPGEEPAGFRFVRDFWGARWPEVEADFRARGKSMDWPQAPTLPWEEVAEVFGQELFPLQDAERQEYLEGNLLRWRGVVDKEWLRNVLGWTSPVDDEQIARIEDLAARHNPQIEALAREWIDRFDFEIRAAFRAGRYEHGPFTLPTGEPGAYFWTSGQGHESGWTARMVLSFDDCPGLEDMVKRIRQLETVRNVEMLAALRAAR